MKIYSRNVKALPFSDKDRAKKLREQFHLTDITCLQEVFSKPFKKVLDDGWNVREWQKFWWWVPFFKTPSGLLTLSQVFPDDVVDIRFRSTSLHRGDFLTVKGAQRITFPWGVLINVHMDAGDKEEDYCAREDQLSTVSQSMPKDGPVIIVGDANLDPKRGKDHQLMDLFVKKHTLKIKLWVDNDVVLMRGVPLKVDTFDDDLSDHPGYLIRTHGDR